MSKMLTLLAAVPFYVSAWAFPEYGVFGYVLGAVCLVAFAFVLHRNRDTSTMQKRLVRAELVPLMEAIRRARAEREAKRVAEEPVAIVIPIVWEERHPDERLPSLQPCPRR